MTKRFTYIENNSISQYSLLPIQEICGKSYHCQGVIDKLNKLNDENEQLKQQLFETRKELLYETSDEVDRALYYEDKVEELRKEIFE